MSHFLIEIADAVGDRLAADATLLALLATHPDGAAIGVGIYHMEAPAVTTVGTIYPCVLYTVKAEPRDTLRDRIRLVTVDINVVCEKSDAAYNGLTRGAAILARLDGDWPQQAAGTAPTFGLDRFHPTMTAWTGDIFDFQGIDEAHADGKYIWVYSLTIEASQAGV